MIDKLLLETKSDIFISAINEFIHQPSIQEIAYHAQGEKKFFEVLDIICKTIVDIDLLKQENSLTSEQIKLFESISSFDYLIGLIAKDVHIFIYLKLLFKIFFPEHECELTDKTDNSGNIVMIIKMTPIPESPHRKSFIIDAKNYDDIIAYIHLVGFQHMSYLAKILLNYLYKKFGPNYKYEFDLLLLVVLLQLSILY